MWLIPLSDNHQESEKMQVYCLQDLEMTQHTWGHTARSQVEVERESERPSMHAQAWGSAFIGAKGGIWAFAGSPCIGEFKTFTSRNLKLGKRRQTSSPNGQLLKSTEMFPKTKEAQ